MRRLALLFVAVLACAPVESVVADVPVEVPSSSCAGNEDCPADSFCAKPSCRERVGVCQRRPLVCSGEAAPVCGCNGVSYWNDCLRKQGASEASTPGECVTGAAPCGGPRAAPCPVPGASCAQLVERREACSDAAPGVCWVLPDRCPVPEPRAPGVRAPSWTPCGGPPRCLEVCEAIRGGGAYRADDRACVPSP